MNGFDGLRETTNAIARAMDDRETASVRAERAIREAQHKLDAAGVCEEVAAAFNEFHASLPPDKDVGIAAFVSGSGINMYVETIGYRSPLLIIFDGFDLDGSPRRLIQHISQISLACVALKRLPEREPIGFYTPVNMDSVE
jgi:hypothetical protein